MPAKPVLAVDIDDVLVPTHAALAGHLNASLGLSIDPDQEEGYGLVEAVMRASGFPQGEVLKRIQAFLLGEEFMAVEPLRGAPEAIADLGEAYAIIAVTARSPELQEVTRAWVSARFPQAIHEVYFPNIAALTEGVVEVNKLNHLVAAGAVALIDDKPSHLLGLDEASIEGILFGDYPWNRAESALPERVKRVRDWGEASRLLLSREAGR